ncbi:hypothetical protein C1645_745217 [Glomus cerebriforme]|uniref:Uncharacterized protein n=1 Tax=Glomus cerebriforme TaxID=658196 RepID=A0A397S261_9GLOM|nr:hypothetical protein C1645_745217 [Glomus cerebriforme]
MESELFELESDLDKKKGTQAGLQIARRGFQLYAGIEFDSVERERKRMKADEKNKEASSFIPNLRDRTQREPRTPENKEQMVLRRKKKVNYAESSDSDEYVEGSKYKNARSKQYVREENNSRESTPCPTTSTVTNTLIVTPNKPIITNTTFNQYSTHVICAFNATIHLVQQTTEKKLHTLLDFVAMFKYLTPKVLDRDMKERSYIVECLSPILRAFRNAFPEVKYEWIEKDVESIKEVNKIFMSNINRRKTDVLVLRLSDMNELLKIEVSGPPYKSTKRHTVGDAKKLLMMAVCSLCRMLSDNLDCPIEDAKKVRTYSIQSVGDRITLFAISLVEKKKYLAVELASCVIPFSFEAITCYARIFNFFAVIRNEFVEQEKVQRKIRSFIPSADDNTEDLREWLHLPDDDLTPVMDDDMDELFL